MAAAKGAKKTAAKKTAAKKGSKPGQAEFTALCTQIKALQVNGSRTLHAGATIDPLEGALEAFASKSGYIVASS